MTDEAPPEAPPGSPESGAAPGDEPESEHDRIGALMSDVVDGTATPAQHAEVKAHTATCERCREELAELRAARDALKSLPPETARPDLGALVEERIHRRSAGRFFGRKTLGDRVPFGVLLIVALVGLVIIAGLLWSSTTGSLRTEPKPRPAPPPAARDALHPPPGP
ncbi:MAG TPA: zf-HC2 domain-containing protein [Kofleriaceae bacterium]|nr:zf-HC2 domain-containing protein [Kofleriaceae bacterium]